MKNKFYEFDMLSRYTVIRNTQDRINDKKNEKQIIYKSLHS